MDAKSDLELCRKKKKLEFMQLEVQKRDIIRIKEDILLPANKPDIREILWDNVQLRGSELHVGDGKLQVEGELFVFVLYDAGDENGTKQWMEYTLPVRGEADVAGCTPDLVADVKVGRGADGAAGAVRTRTARTGSSRPARWKSS